MGRTALLCAVLAVALQYSLATPQYGAGPSRPQKQWTTTPFPDDLPPANNDVYQAPPPQQPQYKPQPQYQPQPQYKPQPQYQPPPPQNAGQPSSPGGNYWWASGSRPFSAESTGQASAPQAPPPAVSPGNPFLSGGRPQQPRPQQPQQPGGGGYGGAGPSGPPQTPDYDIPCSQPGQVCVGLGQCQGGYVAPGANGIRQGQCSSASQTCCQQRQPQPQQPQYRPPPPQTGGYGQPPAQIPRPQPPPPNYGGVGGYSQPQPNYQPQPTPGPYTGPLNTTPYPGCAAALKCVEEQYCTAEGVMANSPQYLTREQQENRVPMSDCQNPETGIIGKCCRDPNYKDPWPGGMMMKNMPGSAPSGPGVAPPPPPPPPARTPFQDTCANSGGVCVPSQQCPSQSRMQPEQGCSMASGAAGGVCCEEAQPYQEGQDEEPTTNPNLTKEANLYYQAPSKPAVPGAVVSGLPQNLPPRPAVGYGLGQPTPPAPLPPQANPQPSPQQSQTPQPAVLPAPSYAPQQKPQQTYAPQPPPRPAPQPTYAPQPPPQSAPKPTYAPQPPPPGPQPAYAPQPPTRPAPQPTYAPQPPPRPAPQPTYAPQPPPQPAPQPTYAPQPPPQPAPQPTYAPQTPPQPAPQPTYAPQTPPRPALQPTYAPQPPPQPAPQPTYAPQPPPQPSPQPTYAPQPPPQPAPQPTYAPQPPPQPAPQPTYAPQPAPQPTYYNQPKYNPQPASPKPTFAPPPPPQPTSRPTFAPQPSPKPFPQTTFPSQPPPQPTYAPPPPSPAAPQPSYGSQPPPLQPLERAPQPQQPAPQLQPPQESPQPPQPPQPEVIPTKPSYGPQSPEACGQRRQVPQPEGLSPGQAAPGEYPWQAIVANRADRNPICGAAVLSKDAIITAAHCVHGMEASDLMVIAGEHLMGVPDPGAQERSVAAIARHPDFNPTSLFNDHAVLRLAEPLTLGERVGTVCLPEQSGQANLAGAAPGQDCVATGWGLKALKGNHVGSGLNAVPARLLGAQEAEQHLRRTFLGPNFRMHQSQVCALATKPQTTLCMVDPGGPLACPKPDGAMVLAGVYSWDVGCHPSMVSAPEGPKSPTAFSAVDADWVRRVMAEPIQNLVQESRNEVLRKQQQEKQPEHPKPGFDQGYGK